MEEAATFSILRSEASKYLCGWLSNVKAVGACAGRMAHFVTHSHRTSIPGVLDLWMKGCSQQVAAENPLCPSLAGVSVSSADAFGRAPMGVNECFESFSIARQELTS